MLRADAVSFAYRSVPVLTDVSLAARSGQRVGILGPNGAGKTTLLHLLAGLLTPTAGHIYLDGARLDRTPRRTVARRLALVPQETTLAFEYSVTEIALMGRHPHLGAFRLEGPDDVDVVMGALDATGTAHLADRPFSTLSGGEKQRVVIASAIAQLIPVRGAARADETALLLDEPTASLDLGARLEMATLFQGLRGLRSGTPVTLLMSTHDLDFAIDVCDHLVLLRRGRVVASGPIETVITPGNVRALYDVDVDVARHAATGRLMVTPLARTGGHGRATRAGAPGRAGPGS